MSESNTAAHRPVRKSLRKKARRMRTQMPESERRFWSAVRAHRFRGFGFRRQAVVVGFVVDFVCHEQKLIVEIDGPSHALSVDRDAARTAKLAAEGYRVVRFWNHDVVENLDGVLGRLADVLADAPPSLTLPHEGGGDETSDFRSGHAN